MRGLRLRAEKAEPVGEHYTQIVKKKIVCEVRILTDTSMGVSKSSSPVFNEQAKC